MITLPGNYQIFNKKAESTPATIVRFGDSLLEDIQGSKGDWENNSSESQVDYNSVPGDVILESGIIPTIDQTLDNDNFFQSVRVGTTSYTRNANIPWQSFKQTTGAEKSLNVVSIGAYIICGGGTFIANYTCNIYSAKESGKLSTGVVVNKSVAAAASPFTGRIDFDFSSQNITIEDNTEYWITCESDITSVPTGAILHAAGYAYQNTNVYADGQLDIEGVIDTQNAGDLNFKITFTGNYFLTPGDITTQIIDLGEIPAIDGEWKFNDTTPSQFGITAVAYTCFGSTDNFGASNVSIGAKTDGDPIEIGDWYRYYKITSTLSTTDINETPAVHDVGLSFVSFVNFSDRDIFGYEQSLDGISSLSTKIDDFALATVSQLTCNLGLTETISNYLFSNFPKNKPAKVLIGFDDPDFLESDFFEIYSGAIDDWNIKPSHNVNVIIKDVSKLWSIDVPKEITAAQGNETSGTYQSLSFSADHPIDAMLEILQNHIGIRDAVIDFGSFETIKATLAGWEITRDFDGPPVEKEKADDLLNELRILTSTYYIPDSTGKIKLKLFDSSEAAIDALTDDDFLSPLSWESNIDKLYNKTFLEFDYDVPNDEFDHVYIGLNAASITNNGETSSYDLEDKWTLNAQETQIESVLDFILDRYANPPARITGEMDRKKLYFEVGDFVTITTTQAPSADLSGISDVKFQITEKNFNQNSNKIKFVFLEV